MWPIDQIYDFRKRHNLTCSALAEMIGVHKSQVTRWEMGTQKIPAWLPKMLALLDEKLSKSE